MEKMPPGLAAAAFFLCRNLLPNGIIESENNIFCVFPLFLSVFGQENTH